MHVETVPVNSTVIGYNLTRAVAAAEPIMGEEFLVIVLQTPAGALRVVMALGDVQSFAETLIKASEGPFVAQSQGEA